MRINQKMLMIVVIVLGLGFGLAWAQNSGVSSGYPVPKNGMSDSEQRGHGLYLRYCYGCHGIHGDGNGENAPYLDPRPRDFTEAIFKCRSTPTGTLPLDSDLLATIERGVWTSGMPSWRPLSQRNREDLLAYIKTFSPRWKNEKPGTPITIPAETPVTMDSINHGKALFQKLECWKCHGQEGLGNGPSANTLTDSKEQPIHPYDFADATDDSRFKCGSTNQDLYKIFMTGVDGTPMPSFADQLQPNDAWDLVHFLRTLQPHRHSKENDVLHGVVSKTAGRASNSQPTAAASEKQGQGSGDPSSRRR